MLESSSPDAIERLREGPGTEVDRVEIRSLSVGQVIRVHTISGNAYLFEVTDPQALKAHVVRCDSRPRAPKSGYRGERRVSSVFEVGRVIIHDVSNTSNVERLVLVK